MSPMHKDLLSNQGEVLMLKRLIRDESGATAIEYSLIAAGISIVIIAVVNGLGAKLTGVFSNVSSQLA
jgi:pilus assembly protein Flp/PilA